MSPRGYDKQIEMSLEEEGTYHRRQVEPIRASSPGSTGRNTTTKTSYQVLRPVTSGGSQISRRHQQDGDSSDNDNYEEWTTTKRKVNHKTRQVETRVSRQLLVEDGKVIADSGPQVTTRIKEDNKVEECEKEKAPKHRERFEALERAPEGQSLGGRVLGEKKEIQRVCREVREENMQYHDERMRELTGPDVHKRALQAPHELMAVDSTGSSSSRPRGEMIKYSNKGKVYQDTDEILEVAKLALDGSITKERKHTRHHEEHSEDERPGDREETEKLRRAPIASRSSRRGVDYVDDFDKFSTPEHSDAEEEELARDEKKRELLKYNEQKHQSLGHSTPTSRPMSSHGRPMNDDYEHESASHRRGRKLSVSSASSASSMDERRFGRARQAPARSTSPARQVEIPAEIRRNRDRLMSRKSGGTSSRLSGRSGAGERSISPQEARSYLSSRREDASVQARLTDEETTERRPTSPVERRAPSSASRQHEKAARQLQRQSTNRSQRNYYYGDSKQSHHPVRSPSFTSTSSASLSDPKEQIRKQGTKSRDSGFRSPQQQQQYHKQNQDHQTSVKRRHQVVSPTLSAGQRSVKTTTTTVSGGLSDRRRPDERRRELQFDSDNEQPQRPQRQRASKHQHEPSKAKRNASRSSKAIQVAESDLSSDVGQTTGAPWRHNERKSPDDSVSLSSFAASTTIRVPYRRIPENQQQQQQQATISTSNNMANERHARSRSTLRTNHYLTTSPFFENSSNESQETRKELNKFQYDPVVANVPKVETQATKQQQQVLATYNVNVIHHRTPFTIGNSDNTLKTTNKEPSSISELSKSIARLELLSKQLSEKDSIAERKASFTINGCDNDFNKTRGDMKGTGSDLDNNNEAAFVLKDFVKCTAMPARTSSRTEDDDQDDLDERGSIISSCSMRSSRTYHIRRDTTNKLLTDAISQEGLNLVHDQNGNCSDAKRPAAWIFDPQNGTSTAIVPPTRPKDPTPKIESRTEHLGEAPGGRSYYLELLEKPVQAEEPVKVRSKKIEALLRARPSSIDSLYARWNSQSDVKRPQAIRSSQLALATPSQRTAIKRPRQIKPASLLDSDNRPLMSSSIDLTSNNINNNNKQNERRFPGGPPHLSNRSKSSSCLSSTKVSKYSIYGGLKGPNGEERKSVPRLSYSRTIGPKTQRKSSENLQPKSKSRYLKMR